MSGPPGPPFLPSPGTPPTLDDFKKAIDDIKLSLSLAPDFRPETVWVKVVELFQDRNMLAGNISGIELMRDEAVARLAVVADQLSDLVEAVAHARTDLSNPPAHAPPFRLVAIMARVSDDLRDALPPEPPEAPVAPVATLPGV